MRKLILLVIFSMFVIIGNIYSQAETFEKFTQGSITTPDTTDISGSLNSYTLITGWTGSYIYQAGGVAKIGQDGNIYNGSNITTPKINLTTSNNNISFNAWCYGYDYMLISVLLSTNNGETWELQSIILLASTSQSYSIPISKGTANSKVRIFSWYGSFFIDNILIKDFPLPITLTSFTSNVVNNNDVQLKWTTEKEEGNDSFEIERKVNSGADWLKIGFIKGAGTVNSPTTYNFTDHNLQTGVYSYRLKQVDYNGNFEYFRSNDVTVKTPTKFTVNQNYPNPFNPTTKISYTVPTDGKVEIKIFDIIGREILSQVEDKTAGYYEFVFNGEKIASGVYFYQIRTGENISIKKMFLIK